MVVNNPIRGLPANLLQELYQQIRVQYSPPFFAAIATFIQAEEIISTGVRHAASAYQHVSRIVYYLFFKTVFSGLSLRVNFEVKHGS
jgi:hypothetical protein